MRARGRPGRHRCSEPAGRGDAAAVGRRRGRRGARRRPAARRIVVVGFPTGDQMARVRTADLLTESGDGCPGVGRSAPADVPLTVDAAGTELILDVTDGPADRLPVFSGDCDGTATLFGDTRARLRLALGETKDCRVTFVRPDDGAVSASDTILFVDKTYDHDPSGRGLPDQTLRLDAAGDSVASRSTAHLDDLSVPGARCPRFGRPTCRWSVALDYDGLPQPLVLSESAASSWLPVIGGDCDARGRLPDDDRRGEAVRCTVDNVLLEAQTGSARNAIVRIEVVGLAATTAAQQATVAVRSFDGDQLSTVGTIGMVGPAGAPCPRPARPSARATSASTLDLDPRGVETERFVVVVESAPAGAASWRLRRVVGATHSIHLGVGELATCRVTSSCTRRCPSPCSTPRPTFPAGRRSGSAARGRPRQRGRRYASTAGSSATARRLWPPPSRPSRTPTRARAPTRPGSWWWTTSARRARLRSARYWSGRHGRADGGAERAPAGAARADVHGIGRVLDQSGVGLRRPHPLVPVRRSTGARRSRRRTRA